jgi:Na+/melibiose symporter-like transporter
MIFYTIDSKMIAVMKQELEARREQAGAAATAN